MSRTTKLSFAVGATMLAGVTALSISPAFAQDDLAGVKAASGAFYSALRTRDLPAMEAAWAHNDSVTYVQPIAPKVLRVGWNEIRTVWEETFIRQIASGAPSTTAIIDPVYQVREDVAWEVGFEGDPSQPVSDTNGIITANVYEKIDGQWLMVSHVRHPAAALMVPPAPQP